MEDKYGIVRMRSGVWRSLRDGDFDEEDVWSVFKDKASINNSSSKDSSPPLRRVTTAAMAIPRACRGGESSVSSGHEGSKIARQSAPVNIPNWPTSTFGHTNKASKSSGNSGAWHGHDYDDEDEGYDDDDDDDDDVDIDDDDYDYKLPPHELIARRLAKSQISSFSVVEGVGRTLKGRDLSKVRNAVLTKTGFLESL